MKEIVIALAGNPNCGKTSVFNALTGMRQKVGNWPGVTVEHVEGTAKYGDTTFKVVDLPGIYSLSSYSQEEIISRDYILDEKPDVIVDVVDADNIERNLYLTTQLAELKIPMVIALNMVDLLEKSGRKIDIKKFSDLLGVPTVPIVATHSDKTGKSIAQSWLGVEGGMDVLLETVEKVAGSEFDLPRSAQHINEIEDEIEKLSAALKVKDTDDIPLRWLLVKTLEGDAEARNRLLAAAEDPDRAVTVLTDTENHIRSVMGDDLETIIADGRYGFIEGLLRETMTVSRRRQRRDMTQKIDRVLLNRVLGIPIFLLMMFASLWVTFNIGGFLQGYI
ncbi:MAG: ferrous iron transporter B, partial [Abditibacteriota bacterium]|nr:ferrous iron transporter B [Abditibacteriota bacterium]